MSEEEKFDKPPEDKPRLVIDSKSQLPDESSFLSEEDKTSLAEAAQPQTLNPQPENMEVHHHGHVHEQKKWKEYLFQFFMLFLAVFCGFLAEYQLEHMIENQREKKFIISMIQDLKTDTVKLRSNIKQFERQLLSQDTLLQNFDLINTGYSQLLSRCIGSFAGYPDFIYTDGTIQQLKNSGGFRLIRSSVAVDSIMAYDAEVKKALINENVLGGRVVTLYSTIDEFFNFQALIKETKAGKTLEQLEQGKFVFTFSTDMHTVGKFYNTLGRTNGMFNIVKGNMETVQIKATRLIKFLEKEYHLEDE